MNNFYSIILVCGLIWSFSAYSQLQRDACVISNTESAPGICYETYQFCEDGYRTFENQPCQRGGYICDLGVGEVAHLYAPGDSSFSWNPSALCEELKQTLKPEKPVKRFKSGANKNACVISRTDYRPGICYESKDPCTNEYKTFRNQPCQKGGEICKVAATGETLHLYAPLKNYFEKNGEYVPWNASEFCRDVENTVSSSKSNTNSRDRGSCFDFYPNTDSVDNDLDMLGWFFTGSNDLDKVAEQCRRNKKCKGYNTLGMMKDKIEKSEHDSVGLHVKRNLPHCIGN